MKIFYQAYNDWTREHKEFLQSYGYSVDVGYSSVEIDLSQTNEQLLEFLDKWGVEKFVATVYEKNDYKYSSLFFFLGVRENGYPQPENVEGYLKSTYDLNNYCDVCGIGAVQNAPFRLKSKPTWKKGLMFELNWVYDEVFVRKDLYESLFKNKYEVGFREVVLHKTGEIIPDVVQLILPNAQVPLLLQDTPFIICTKCGRKRYEPQVKGFVPGFQKSLGNIHIFKCSEYFGTGSTASNRIFISRNLVEDLKALNIKPTIWPVDPSYKHNK